jgi:hypothetical protein
MLVGCRLRCHSANSCIRAAIASIRDIVVVKIEICRKEITQQLTKPMSKPTPRIILSVITLAFSLSSLVAAENPIDAFSNSPVWWVLVGDVRGDGRDASLPDAAQFAYRYDKEHDFLWFRVRLYTPVNEQAFGVNIAFDTSGDDSANCPASPAPSLAPSATKMNWWGANKDFKFDSLLTAWVTRGEKGYQGTIGIGDAAGAKAKNFNNLMQDNLRIRTERDAIIIGVKRTDITDKMKMNLIAAVGSNERWNDDLPNPALKFVTIDLAAPRPARGLRDVDLSRNNLQFPPGYKLQGETEGPRIEKKGKGQEPLILIPGVFSGKDAFAGFIARNESRYTFYIVTPPGLNGTPSRGLPPESTSYGDLTWTRRIERDVLDLISREKLIKPVLVAHGFPASIVADEVALRHPDSIAGVIDVAAMPTRFALRSPKDLSGKTPATADERVQIANDLARYWFKYVTPETWESNNYQAEMFANDPEKAEQVRRETETAPLEVKIHYLCEAIAVDFTNQFSANKAPLLALIPGFDEKFLTDPATSPYKTVFQDAWQNYSKFPNVQLVTIPNARALILDDQPQLADDAIASFIKTARERAKS